MVRIAKYTNVNSFMQHVKVVDDILIKLPGFAKVAHRALISYMFDQVISILIILLTFHTFLQEKATKWQDNVEIDGLTTNGVLIMHPKGQFCGGSGKCGCWRECSVGGDVFSLRESRSAQQKGQPVRDLNSLAILQNK